MWCNDLELRIIKHGKENDIQNLNKDKEALFEKYSTVMYNLNRFLSEYGEIFEENPELVKIYASISDEYSAVQRLFKILSAYDKTNN